MTNKNSKYYIESGLIEILFKYSKLQNVRSWGNLICVFLSTCFFSMMGFLYVHFNLNQEVLVNLLASLSNIFGVLIGFAISSFGILASCGNLDFIRELGKHKINSENKISTLKKIMIIFSHFLFSLILTFSYILFLYMTSLFTEDLNFSYNTILAKSIFIIGFTLLGLLISHSLVQTKVLISNLYGLTLTQANMAIWNEIKILIQDCKDFIEKKEISKAQNILDKIKTLADEDYDQVEILEKEINSIKIQNDREI